MSRLSELVKSWIPNGDGYNSQYAHDMAEVAERLEELEGLTEKQAKKIEKLKAELEKFKQPPIWIHTGG